MHIGNPCPVTGNNSNPIKVVKRDKSAVGGLPRKILTTFHLVQEEEINEETTLNICGTVVSSIQEIVDFVDASSQGNLHGSDILEYIQKQENILQQCISQLMSSTTIRVTLISQLKEALQDQESKLDLLQNELHVAHSQIKKAEYIKLKLTSSPTLQTMNQPMFETEFSTVKNRGGPSFSYEEECTKAAAAALAAQLTSISSSVQMLTSVLSSLVAEEAASRSAGLKQPKLEPPPPPFSSLNNAEPWFEQPTTASNFGVFWAWIITAAILAASATWKWWIFWDHRYPILWAPTIDPSCTETVTYSYNTMIVTHGVGIFYDVFVAYSFISGMIGFLNYK